MKKNLKIIAGTLLVAIAGFFIYKNINKKTSSSTDRVPRSTKENIDFIVQNGMSTNTNNVLSTFDDLYLKAWADAIEVQNNTFTYGGKIYLVKGGKQKA